MSFGYKGSVKLGYDAVSRINVATSFDLFTSLETIFSFCDKSISRFATCYDGKGDGTPDGAIGKHLDRNQILIGKEFWEEILEDGVSYNDFILAYQEAYKKAKVEETVIG